MTKKIVFGEFEFPIFKGLNYIFNGNKEKSQFLFVNGPNEIFSMYFEDGMQRFIVPDKFHLSREYYLFEINSSTRKIKFFCPEKWENLNSVIWYFCLELIDENGCIHCLPGQVRLELKDFRHRFMIGKPLFIKVLEQIKLNRSAAAV